MRWTCLGAYSSKCVCFVLESGIVGMLEMAVCKIPGRLQNIKINVFHFLRIAFSFQFMFISGWPMGDFFLFLSLMANCVEPVRAVFCPRTLHQSGWPRCEASHYIRNCPVIWIMHRRRPLFQSDHSIIVLYCIALFRISGETITSNINRVREVSQFGVDKLLMLHGR